MATIKCTNSVKLPFSATFLVPKTFEYTDATEFSIAVSTDNLLIYKEIIDYPVEGPVMGPCGQNVQGQVIAKLGQVKVSGLIVYRVAANGIKSDPLIVSDDLKKKVNVDGNMWSSGDGFVEINDGENNFMIVGFILPNEELDPGLLTITLTSLVQGSTDTEDRSGDKVVTLEGEFTVSYNKN